jgi:hypothetical protein
MEAVVGVGFVGAFVMVAAELVGAARHDLGDEGLHRPAMLDEARREVVEQGGVGRGLARGPEVVGSLDETDAEEMLPDAVGHDPRGEGMLGAGDPAGELEPAALLGIGTRRRGIAQNLGKTPRRHFAEEGVLAADVDGDVLRLGDVASGVGGVGQAPILEGEGDGHVLGAAGGLAVAGDVEPVAPPALAEMRRGEELVDLRFEIRDLIFFRRQPRQVEGGPAGEGGRIRVRDRPQPTLLQRGEDKAVDVGLRPIPVVLHLGHGGLGDGAGTSHRLDS